MINKFKRVIVIDCIRKLGKKSKMHITKGVASDNDIELRHNIHYSFSIIATRNYYQIKFECIYLIKLTTLKSLDDIHINVLIKIKLAGEEKHSYNMQHRTIYSYVIN